MVDYTRVLVQEEHSIAEQYLDVDVFQRVKVGLLPAVLFSTRAGNRKAGQLLFKTIARYVIKIENI